MRKEMNERRAMREENKREEARSRPATAGAGGGFGRRGELPQKFERSGSSRPEKSSFASPRSTRPARPSLAARSGTTTLAATQPDTPGLKSGEDSGAGGPSPQSPQGGSSSPLLSPAAYLPPLNGLKPTIVEVQFLGRHGAPTNQNNSHEKQSYVRETFSAPVKLLL